ncbi:zinc finger protein 26-like [Phlebotomus argentipes]|uniref:zinc finger protein 26-like n=1 Tax=Phlebotomus argentipes TaxID=94469 RepID=UPI002892DFC7|nr:zinc finger protein 26-like [Phlebotomus argentipes]
MNIERIMDIKVEKEEGLTTESEDQNVFECDVVKEEYEIHESSLPEQQPQKLDESNGEFIHFVISEIKLIPSKVSFECAHCLKTFRRKCNLLTHLRAHFEKPLPCPICKKVVKNTLALQWHRNRTHGITKPCECRICGKDFIARSRLELRKHMKKIHSCAPQNCHICGKSFPTKYTFERHMGIHRINECQICFRKFSIKRLLEEHMSIHSGEKPFTCDICNKKFRLDKDIKQHKKIHLPPTGMLEKCIYCPKTFKTLEGLKSHVKAYHRGLPRAKKSVPMCTICKEVFQKYDELLAHVKIHKRVFRFECAMCGKKSAHKYLLRQHIEKIHLKATDENKKCHKCSICTKAFKRVAQLQIHMTSHSSDLPFCCLICSNRYKVKTTLKTHMEKHQLLHEEDKNCPYCSKTFERMSSMKNHLKFSHRGLTLNTINPPFRCSVCKQIHKTLEGLKKHALLHKNDFKCEICKKKFHDNRMLRKHFEVFHTKIEKPKIQKTPKVFKCPMCEKKLKSKYTLQRHLISCKRKTSQETLRANESSRASLKLEIEIDDIKEEIMDEDF